MNTKIHVRTLSLAAATFAILGTARLTISRSPDTPQGSPAVAPPAATKRQNSSQQLAYPPGKLGKTVRLGRQLVQSTSTHPLTQEYAGNSLNCTSCHLDSGTHEKAATFLGVAAAYPAFAPRENKVISLEDRILNCFIRSQNGTRPPNGGEVAIAIAAYITWLSEGTSIAMNPAASLGRNHLKSLDDPAETPSVDRGRVLYGEQCAYCHSNDGQGTEEGPPVWGERSFNDGAGLFKAHKMASWLKVAMPLDDASLTEQECFDLAAFLNSKPRPRFQDKYDGRRDP